MDFISDNLKEIIIALLSFFAGMTTQIFISKKKKTVKQRQEAGDNSTQFQSAGNMTANKP